MVERTTGSGISRPSARLTAMTESRLSASVSKIRPSMSKTTARGGRGNGMGDGIAVDATRVKIPA